MELMTVVESRGTSLKLMTAVGPDDASGDG